MDEIRIAVVGLGGRGIGWIANLQRLKGYRVVAVCDPIVALHERALARGRRRRRGGEQGEECERGGAMRHGHGSAVSAGDATRGNAAGTGDTG